MSQKDSYPVFHCKSTQSFVAPHSSVFHQSEELHSLIQWDWIHPSLLLEIDWALKLSQPCSYNEFSLRTRNERRQNVKGEKGKDKKCNEILFGRRRGWIILALFLLFFQHRRDEIPSLAAKCFGIALGTSGCDPFLGIVPILQTICVTQMMLCECECE
jgi:hypothetical protein